MFKIKNKKILTLSLLVISLCVVSFSSQAMYRAPKAKEASAQEWVKGMPEHLKKFVPGTSTYALEKSKMIRLVRDSRKRKPEDLLDRYIYGTSNPRELGLFYFAEKSIDELKEIEKKCGAQARALKTEHDKKYKGFLELTYRQFTMQSCESIICEVNHNDAELARALLRHKYNISS